MSEQAVIIKFDYGAMDLARLFELEELLEAALVKQPVGAIRAARRWRTPDGCQD